MTGALQNIHRMVKPGGKIAIISFAGEAFSPMAEIFVEQYKATGREMPPPSWKRLATKALISEQFKQAGINRVNIHLEPLGYTMTDPQMWWDVVWNAGWRIFLGQMAPPEVETFRVEHFRRIADVLGADGVWFNTEVLIAIADKYPGSAA